MKNNYLAPNGKKSNLTDSQYKLVRTKAFKDWFGDWENDPENASKVVDENGEPLVVYHFSTEKFNVFELKGNSDGFFFTPLKKDSEFSYTRKGKSYFLNIKILGVKEDIYHFNWSIPYYENKWIKDAKENKENGIVFIKYVPYKSYQIKKQGKKIYVAFYPNQIKLADGTNTTFDSNNNDIRYKKGGMTNKGYVSYKDKYNTKYGYKNGESHDLEEISKDTGVSMKGLQQIYNKGIGAYKNNPQSVRPNVKSKEQWAMARVYSSVMGGKASKIDSNELKMNLGGNVHIGESTEFYERTYADGTKQRFSIEDYEKNIYPLLEKQMENKKFDGGGGVGKLNYADGRKFRIRVKQKKGY